MPDPRPIKPIMPLMPADPTVLPRPPLSRPPVPLPRQPLQPPAAQSPPNRSSRAEDARARALRRLMQAVGLLPSPRPLYADPRTPFLEIARHLGQAEPRTPAEHARALEFQLAGSRGSW